MIQRPLRPNFGFEDQSRLLEPWIGRDALSCFIGPRMGTTASDLWKEFVPSACGMGTIFSVVK